ncbi:MAG: hypothetical protein ABIJ85_00465 [bacterium]|nr:hypothetical protein [Nitrospinota bacterium]
MPDENTLENEDENENNAFDTIDKLFSDNPVIKTQDDIGGYDDSKEVVPETKEDKGELEETTADRLPKEVLTVSDSSQEPLLMETKPSHDKKIEKSKELDEAGNMGDLDMLEGYAMALEWEFTDKDIKKFNYYLNKLAAQYTDSHNQILIKLLRAIVNYISSAQEKAVPETMSILSKVLKTLKMVNSGDKDKSFVKAKIRESYQEVLNLKKRISSYNKEFNEEKEEEEKEEVIAKEPTVSIQPPQESIPQSLLSRLDELLLKLDEYEKRISYLEEQNRKLKNIIIGL